jgi:hypothetical protein
MQDHGGDVVVEKTAMHGTVFKLVLPLGASAANPSHAVKSAGMKAPLARTKFEGPE